MSYIGRSPKIPNLTVEDVLKFDSATDAATGSNATLTLPATPVVRLTNASLVSIDMIPAGQAFQTVFLINATGVDVAINNNTGATAANRILTGQKATVTLKDEMIAILVYDSTETRWMVVASLGGGSGAGAYQVALLKDVKSNGTNGGTSVATTWQTRTLNTITDPDSIVTSLTSNQFVLPAGDYYIEASAPGHATSRHKIKIRNITDSTDDIIGVSSFTGAGGADQDTAFLKGYLNLAGSKTFELQHYMDTATASIGLGIASSFGVNEIYSMVTIVKL